MQTKFKQDPQGRERADFSSLTELIEAADALPIDSNRAKHFQCAVRCNDFTNNYNLERAKKELRDPPPAAAEVRKIAGEITAGLITQPRRKILRRQAEGDELDPLAWLHRDPDGWTRTVRTQHPRPVIKIALNVSSNFHRKPEELHCRGAAACALADALEHAGNRVQIDLFAASQRLYEGTSPYTKTGRRRKRIKQAPELAITRATVKHAHQPLDIDAAALALAEIGFFRTVLFCAELALANHTVSENLGSEAKLPEDIAAEYEIIIDSDITTPDAARQIVEKYTTKQENAAA